MSGKFEWTSFKDVDLFDPFFDSLKKDYKEFPQWFERKSLKQERALVFKDESGIGAFLYLKEEKEPLKMKDKIFPDSPRMKIGTLKLAERFRGVRLGEGAIGVALWKWKRVVLMKFMLLFLKSTTL